MFRLPLPFTDAVLLLSPPAGEGNWLLGAVWLLAAAIVLGAAVFLYRFELRLVRGLVSFFLAASRLAVLFGLLAIVAFQPVVARETVDHLPGRVLIAVDRSASMEVADPQRSPVDKLRLVRALKLARDLCPDRQLDDWIRQYETSSSPRWVAEDEALDDPARRQQLAEERRRQHDRICARVDSLTRSDVARKVLASDGAGLLEAVAARHRIELVGFARDAWDVGPSQLDQLYRPTAPSLSSASDLGLPLSRALNRSEGEEQKILGVVLLTDGQHNTGPSPVARAIELGLQSVPIYPVPLGPRQPPPDVAVAAVKAPPAVFKDVDTQVEARVRVSGLNPQDIRVELVLPGQPTQAELLRHDGGDHVYTVPLQARLEQVGANTLTVTAGPVAGEIRTDNNSRSAVVNVTDDKAKVLIVDGEARWEYHYLANALARDRAVESSGVVFAQPRLGRIAEEELRKVRYAALALPPGPDAFAPYDCLILGDVSPAQLPRGDRVRLEKYVADRGGTLVIVAGKRSMPLAFVGGSDPDEPLRRLLPIVEPHVVHTVKGFSLALTPDGQAAPFLKMSSPAQESLDVWSLLPAHYWGVVGQPKPGATALGYVAEDKRAGGEPAGRDGNQALIVRQHYGFGRVLYVGLESTWRWRFKAGDAYHHRFWGQVVRWAAADKPLLAGNEHVRFGTHDPVYTEGQEVEVVVRLSDEVPAPAPGGLAGARILRRSSEGKEDAVALVPVERKEGQPRVLEGRVRNLPAGAYAVELVIPELADGLVSPAREPNGSAAPLRAAFTVTPGDGDEMTDLSSNWSLLEELAQRSGGRVFPPEEAAALVEHLIAKAVTRTRRTENRLWEWWPTLVFLLALLTAEWVVRKWAGLP